jgi:hypothetical protein
LRATSFGSPYYLGWEAFSRDEKVSLWATMQRALEAQAVVNKDPFAAAQRHGRAPDRLTGGGIGDDLQGWEVAPRRPAVVATAREQFARRDRQPVVGAHDLRRSAGLVGQPTVDVESRTRSPDLPRELGKKPPRAGVNPPLVRPGHAK